MTPRLTDNGKEIIAADGDVIVRRWHYEDSAGRMLRNCKPANISPAGLIAQVAVTIFSAKLSIQVTEPTSHDELQQLLDHLSRQSLDRGVRCWHRYRLARRSPLDPVHVGRQAMT